MQKLAARVASRRPRSFRSTGLSAARGGGHRGTRSSRCPKTASPTTSWPRRCSAPARDRVGRVERHGDRIVDRSATAPAKRRAAAAPTRSQRKIGRWLRRELRHTGARASARSWSHNALVSLPAGQTSPAVELIRRGLLAVLFLAIVVVLVWFDRDSCTDTSDGTVSLVDAIYYATVALGATGYGDITPVAPHARIVNAIVVTPLRIAFLVLLVSTTWRSSRTRVGGSSRMDGGDGCAITSWWSGSAAEAEGAVDLASAVRQDPRRSWSSTAARRRSATPTCAASPPSEGDATRRTFCAGGDHQGAR